MPPSSEPDEYGQIHPSETPSLLRSKLEDFEFEVAKIHKKDAYQQAQVQCPDQLTEAFKLMFLRCEVFNADVRTSVVSCSCQGSLTSSTDSPAILYSHISWQRADSSSIGKSDWTSLDLLMPFAL